MCFGFWVGYFVGIMLGTIGVWTLLGFADKRWGGAKAR